MPASLFMANPGETETVASIRIKTVHPTLRYLADLLGMLLLEQTLGLVTKRNGQIPMVMDTETTVQMEQRILTNSQQS